MAKTITNSTKEKGLVKATLEKNLLFSLLSGVLSLCLLLALFFYQPSDLHKVGFSGETPEYNQNEDTNIPVLGELGNYIAYAVFSSFGLSAWILPWLFVSLCILFATSSTIAEKTKKISTLVFGIVSLSTLANVQNSTHLDSQIYISGLGGKLGALLYSGLPLSANEQLPHGLLGNLLGPWGTSILMIIVLIYSMSVHFSFSLLSTIKTFEGIKRNFTNVSAENDKFNQSSSRKDNDKSEKKFSLKSLFKRESTGWFKDKEEDLLFGDVSRSNVQNTKIITSSKKTVAKSTNKPEDDKKSIDRNSDSTKALNSQDPEIAEEIKLKSANSSIAENNEQNVASNLNDLDGFKVVRAEKTEKAGDLFPERKGDYHFPTLELLMDPPEEVDTGDEDHMLKAKRLKETLMEFKIEVELGEVHTGPVITRYDIHPAAGVRVEKIANLDKNLAMALKAESVRILAPVPGKGCVGVEVPNAKPMPVCMKEILQSKAWAEAGAEIPIVLGKEASGRPLVADLTKMPHLLVAGSTGSGKTVCINSIIASLCYHSSPEDVRFIMVDPKIVEMKVYNDLPHMLIPVVTEPKKVPGALKWLLVEMERRYQIFSKIGVRNIAGFNAKILKDKKEKEKALLLDAEMTAEERAALSSIEVPRDDDVLEIPENKLPYIVCIIDELADLMMVAQADVETGIARLAQLARAAGIHLIIATQRPSVNVITGVIKANLPSRISFRVASYRDSQTILDGKGAEALIGKGDMLFIPPGSSAFARAQGAFVSDDEINGIVEFLKINGPPQIIEEVQEQVESAGQEDLLGGDGENSEEDPMARKAIEIIRSTKRASTSNLQRKLSIGYNRAARIMDDLEDRGLVGPDVPGQGREILMDL